MSSVYPWPYYITSGSIAPTFLCGIALYQDEEFCMEFSSEKIETELIGKLRDSFHIDIQLDYEGPNNTIDYISIEPQKDNLAIRFYGFETSLYVLDEKIMLVDDNQLKQYTYDHTYGNVVYSGKLRNLTHVKILSLLLDLVKCFINCTSVKAEILETKAPNMESYHKNDYILSVTTTDTTLHSKIFSNIRINYIYNDV